MIHWPGVSGLQSNHVDNKKYRRITWLSLSRLHEAGLIKSIGVSNYLIQHLEDLKTCDSIKSLVPAVNQVEWHPHYHNTELLKYCRENGIFLQAYSSLGGSKSNATSLRNDSIIIKIAKNLGKSPVQILLRWAFQQNIGILPKGSSKEHIEENIDLGFNLSEEDMDTLASLKAKEKFAWDPTVVS